MIPEKSTHSVSTGDFQTKQFGIDSEDFSHLVDLIQNQLYSNKILAIIREYSCNAYDANVMAGRRNVPIKITLPSVFSSQIVFRDNGNGLSQDEMENVFTRYGKSTKRTSNETIGAFGIGGKCYFAYSPSFIVNSFKDGIKTSYNCVLDETNVGKLVTLMSEPSNEPSGLEIIGNVKKDDVQMFRDEVMKFFRHWDVMPNIEGFGEQEYAAMRGTDKVILSGTGWSMTDGGTSYYRNRSTTAIMGNIGYPVQWHSVKGLKEMLIKRSPNDHYNLEQFITDNNIVFRFDIGEVKMSPSRETLQYTDLTNNALVKRVETMLDEVSVEAQAKINTATTIWQAKVMFDEMFSTVGCLVKLRNSIKLNYNGIEIKNNKLVGFDKFVGVLKTYNRRNTNFYGYDSGNHMWNTIDCANKKTILEIDQTDKVYIQKAVNYIHSLNGSTTVYVLNFTDKTQRDAVFAATHLDDAFIMKYSTISDAVKNTIIRRSTTGGSVSVKNDTTVRSLRCVSSDMNRSWYYRKVSDLSSEDVDMVDGGIYIETNHNDIVGNHTVGDIIDTVKAISKYDEVPLTVHFIGQNLVGGKLMAQGNWVKYNDYIESKAKEVIANDADLELMASFNAMNNTDGVFTFESDFVDFVKKNKASIGAELTEVNKFFIDSKANEMYLVKNHINATDASKKKIKDAFAALKAKYPLIEVINSNFRYSGSGNKQEILDYLK
jgi:hypothetical protein